MENMAQINDCGIRAASHYPDIQYWDYNWRKMVALAAWLRLVNVKNSTSKNIVAVYSLRDTNRWRMSNGRDRIKIGVKFYSNAMEND